MRSVVFVCGYPGAGKTTVVRLFIDACQVAGKSFCPKRGEDKKGYWLETTNRDVVVFGRWREHEAVFPTRAKNNIAGRCDGGDRNQPGRANFDCIRLLHNLPADCLVISDSINGCVLNAGFVEEASKLGYEISVEELDVPRSVAFARARQRDGLCHNEEKTAKFCDKWDKRRNAWTAGLTKRRHRFKYSRTCAPDVFMSMLFDAGLTD